MDRTDALTGALVADAASMGLHWLYDQAHIKTLEAGGDVAFRQPDSAHYENRKAYFAHAHRRSGELSHYGESARIVGQLALNSTYSTHHHREAFLESFGPCGCYVGYADRPTKALVARMLIEQDALTDPSGCDDDQMPSLCVVAGLFSGNYTAGDIEKAVQVLSVNETALEGALVVFECLRLLYAGETMENALANSAQLAGHELRDKLNSALTEPAYQPLDVALKFGMPCHIPQGLPVVWHLLLHAQDFASCVRDNIRCGGDSCGRAMALGALAGLHFSVPADWQGKLTAGILLRQIS